MAYRKVKRWHVVVAVAAVATVGLVAAHKPQSCAPTLNCAVTQSTIRSTICKSGYTGTIRPSASYTTTLKVQQIRLYGYQDTNPASYEEDHEISLEVGGNPTNHENLWPEPIAIAHQDDQVENQIKASICSGQQTLAQGQAQELQLKLSHGYKPELSKQ